MTRVETCPCDSPNPLGALWAWAEIKKLLGNLQTQAPTEQLIPTTIFATVPFATSSFLYRAPDVVLLTLPAAADGHSV